MLDEHVLFGHPQALTSINCSAHHLNTVQASITGSISQICSVHIDDLQSHKHMFEPHVSAIYWLKASERIKFKLVVVINRFFRGTCNYAGSRTFQRGVDSDHLLATRWMSDHNAKPPLVFVFFCYCRTT
jgi:hypothetical protein